MSEVKRNVMIVGATSSIAMATAVRFAEEGAHLYLIARSEARLAAAAENLRARGAGPVGTTVLDLTDYGAHSAAIEAAYRDCSRFDVVLVAHGALPDQAACEREPWRAADAFAANAVSTATFLLALAPRLEAQREGRVVVIGSVAGDRGRRGNYVYGAAKAAVDVFLQGFRQRMAASGVRVITVKPGFVDTPMTEHLPKNPLFASPRTVGSLIHRVATRGRRDVVYVPGYWALIMAVIRMIPEPLFRRMRL